MRYEFQFVEDRIYALRRPSFVGVKSEKIYVMNTHNCKAFFETSTVQEIIELRMNQLRKIRQTLTLNQCIVVHADTLEQIGVSNGASLFGVEPRRIWHCVRYIIADKDDL